VAFSRHRTGSHGVSAYIAGKTLLNLVAFLKFIFFDNSTKLKMCVRHQMLIGENVFYYFVRLKPVVMSMSCAATRKRK